MVKKIIILSSLLMTFIFLFQNCSEGVGFDSALKGSSVDANNINTTELDPQDQVIANEVTDFGVNVVCNPLDPSQSCSQLEPDQGLIGKLYYLTPEIHGAQFANNLRNAVIDDYRNFGIQVPVNLVMTSVNITPRSWETGFYISSSEHVQTESGDKLFEWFHLDMLGFISLPAGDYQFATLSDDGMRISLNNQVVINADGTHGPRYDCSSSTVSFEAGEKKLIRVQYFQGPRTQIAMQLLVRPAAKSNLACGSSGQLESIDPEHFSRN